MSGHSGSRPGAGNVNGLYCCRYSNEGSNVAWQRGHRRFIHAPTEMKEPDIRWAIKRSTDLKRNMFNPRGPVSSNLVRAYNG